MYKDSPTDALLKLRAEGYQTIYVQSTTLIEGSEMTSVRRDADKLRPFFQGDKSGKSPALLRRRLREGNRYTDRRTAGKERRHCLCGARQPATQHGYLRHARLHDESPWTENFHVSTIEGYPTLDATLLQTERARPKSVTLVPLLLVCGNHTKEDIAGVWKTELEKQGYQVNVRMQGLGENKAIRQLYMEHIKAMLKD